MEIKDIKQLLVKHYESTSEIERFINKLFIERNCAIGLQKNAEHERNQLREELKSAYLEIEQLQETCKNQKHKQKGCNLCNNFDFDKVCVTNCFGNLTISLCGGSKIPYDSERFKLCPICGANLHDKE